MVRRGEVWWADLPDPVGSGPGYLRPILIIQSDHFNKSKMATVIGVVITSNTRLARAPGNVLVPQGVASLTKESVVNDSQIVTIDRAILVNRIGVMPAPYLKQVEIGLQMTLGMR